MKSAHIAFLTRYFLLNKRDSFELKYSNNPKIFKFSVKNKSKGKYFVKDITNNMDFIVSKIDSGWEAYISPTKNYIDFKKDDKYVTIFDYSEKKLYDAESDKKELLISDDFSDSKARFIFL